jgi:hypothetical protein
MSKGEGSEITYIMHKPSSIITKGTFTSGVAMLTNSGRLVSQTNNS